MWPLETLISTMTVRIWDYLVPRYHTSFPVCGFCPSLNIGRLGKSHFDDVTLPFVAIFPIYFMPLFMLNLYEGENYFEKCY